MKWCKTGWGKELKDQFDPTQNFYIDATSAVYHNKSLIEVSKQAIKRICEEYPAPYTLMLSGGIDSQAMLWCWINSGVEFSVVTVKYVNDLGNILNHHDISNIEEVSQKNNVPVTYLNFDIINFLENYLIEYAIRYQCTSPQLTAYMCMSEMIYDGTVLFSGDFLVCGGYNYTILGLKRYADISKRNIIPFFFLHDSELTTTLHQTYKLPKHLDSINTNSEVMKKTHYNMKVNSMIELGVPLIPQKEKLSGFEEVKNIYDKRTDLVTIKDRLKFAHMPSKRLFDIIFRYKLTEIIHYEDNIKWIL
jgi:asparagine synthetase B (glutamine-hydrolysing)